MTQIPTDQRNEKVRAVLASTQLALGPTEIARRIDEPWCKSEGYFQSGAIVPVLRRIGAVGIKGKYTLPAAV